MNCELEGIASVPEISILYIKKLCVSPSLRSITTNNK